MENSIFKLTLTKQGKQALANRLNHENKGPIPLLVALGSGSKVAEETDTQLDHSEMEIEPVSIKSGTELMHSLHITACFPAEKQEFDIKEIGLFLKDTTNILFGRYVSEKTIARKTAQIDFLLDIVIDIGSYNAEHFTINSNDYKPQFSLAKATEQHYGNVRFANRDEVLKKKPNLALSINILNYAGILPKKALCDAWTPFKKFTIECNECNTLTFAIVGLHHYIQQQKNQIAILLVPKIPQKKLIYLFYDISNEKISDNNNYNAYTYSTCNTFAINQANNKINFLISCNDNSKIKLTKIPIPDSSREEIISPDFLFETDTSPGGLFYFNNIAYAMGGYDGPSNIISCENEGAKEKETFTLINHRKKPLVHLIQDKVYILGGSLASETDHTSVEIFDPINHRSFSPFTSQISEIENTENITSCVLENKIYIFFINQFTQNYAGDKFYYYYDYLGNNWKKKSIAKDIQINNPETNLQGKAITIADEIYLFFTNTIQNDDKNIELSFIKLQPV